MPGRVAGKVVVVTGGARGQGAAEAAALAAEGATVIAADVLDRTRELPADIAFNGSTSATPRAGAGSRACCGTATAASMGWSTTPGSPAARDWAT